MDVLSDVLSTVRMTGAFFFHIEAHLPWGSVIPTVADIAHRVMPEHEVVIPFHVVTKGSCWAEMSDDPASAIRVHEGDVVVFPRGDEHVFTSTPGLRDAPADPTKYDLPPGRRRPLRFVLNEANGPETCSYVCGYFGCDARPFNPLLDALPAMFRAHTSASNRAWLSNLALAGVDESEKVSAGGDTMLSRLAELMFVEVMRQHIDALPEDARGWLSGLRDRHVGKSLALIHARPTESWTLESLAREVGLSRSVFAERFTDYVGIPPAQYLARWRLTLAARLLEDPQTSIAQAGARVGYESAAAFQRAFKKHVGSAPGEWRRRHRAQADAIGSMAG
jgi:AraC-like DNA-binding protein